MIREDFDRIVARRVNNKRFNGRVSMYFCDTQVQEITLPTAQDIELPSEREAQRLRKLIKEEKDKLPLEDAKMQLRTGINFRLVTSPLESRIAGLERDLKNVETYYSDDDLYEIFELRSHKLNITIINEGDEYIEDASLQVDINKMDGLIINDKIYPKPDHSKNKYLVGNTLDIFYPEIEDKGDYILIHNSRTIKSWNIKHGIPAKAFSEPVRFLFLKDLAGHVVDLKCKLFGKNLKEPIEASLKINVVTNDSPTQE